MYMDRFREFSSLISRTEKALQKAKAEYVRGYGLRGVHVSCLLALYERPEGLPATELASVCGVDRAQVSRVVSELTEMGLISGEAGGQRRRYRSPLLLSDEGRFAVVLPADEAARFIGICRDVLLPVRRTDVRTTPRHAAKRVLLEFVHTSSAPAPDRTELVIGTGVHEQYTPEYRALTRDFYLKF